MALGKVDFLASAGLAVLRVSRMAGQDIRFHVIAIGSAALRPMTMTGPAELAVFPRMRRRWHLITPARPAHDEGW